MSTLVLITGTGRSGTSTMSGTFDHLGLYVPGPYLGANESNPKGFFESRWAVRFHKRLASGAGINDFDGRPEALELARRGMTDELRAELREFLARESRDHDQVVVKDPRSVWAQREWRDAAADVGLDICFVSMLRHPAEVVGSRTTYYAKPEDVAAQRTYAIFNVGRWINGSLVSERQTRGQRRAFVSYLDLLDDWRPVLVGLAEDFGLRYDVDVAGGEASRVDDFIEPGLRRHQVTWDDLEIPAELQSIAQAVWEDLLLLQAGHGQDDAASADLDAQAERYRSLYATSVAIAHDFVETERRRFRELTEQPRWQKQEAAAAKKAAPATRATAAKKAPAPREVADRPVREVGGRDLLRVVVGRLRRKVTRS